MLISIIIPAYNVEDYIEECIHSAFAQTHKPIEVICIDNNSTDNTWQKLKQLQETYPSLLIEKELKPGAPAARNKGLALSKGEWIQFLDADDILLPEKIEHQIKHITSGISFIAAASFAQAGDIRHEIKVNINNNIWENLAKVNLGITSSNLFSRKYINKVNGWDESLKSSQEYDLMFRMLKTNPNITYDTEPLTIINHVPGSITRNSSNLIRNLHTRIELLDRIRTHVRSIQMDKNSLKEIDQALFDVIRELTNYIPEDGCKAYKRYFNHKYKPIKSQATTHKYLILHQIFGYKNAHQIIKLLKSR
jgi:glycosyltransferase involved in cell wall biosynthesis